MIDTRTKILALSQAPRGRRVLTACFDPMLPAHIGMLKDVAAGGTLVILLLAPEDAYLEPRARAELAASLHFVEAVVISTGDVAGDLATLAPSERIAADEQERLIRAEFLAYVRHRARQP
ncbi:MAG: hypothetical protein HY820_02585 [Acidobacteria bacterium]|nr:hypothetical protein [Acidobacteriota bacterium]